MFSGKLVISLPTEQLADGLNLTIDSLLCKMAANLLNLCRLKSKGSMQALSGSIRLHVPNKYCHNYMPCVGSKQAS